MRRILNNHPNASKRYTDADAEQLLAVYRALRAASLTPTDQPCPTDAAR